MWGVVAILCGAAIVVVFLKALFEGAKAISDLHDATGNETGLW